jgi:hypothetical protein
LHVGGDITDLVEKAGARVGLLKHPALLGEGTGKRAPHVAEQFTLEQRFGHGAAVDGDKGTVAAGAVLVESSCHQFLSRTALAQNQDGAFRGRRPGDSLVHVHHRRAAADNGPQGRHIFAVAAGLSTQPGGAALCQRTGHGVLQLLEVHRFRRVVERPLANRFNGDFH